MFCLFHDFVQESALDRFIYCKKCGKKINFGKLSNAELEIKRLKKYEETMKWIEEGKNK